MLFFFKNHFKIEAENDNNIQNLSTEIEENENNLRIDIDDIPFLQHEDNDSVRGHELTEKPTFKCDICQNIFHNSGGFGHHKKVCAAKALESAKALENDCYFRNRIEFCFANQ